jgi:hypothetical protein
LNLRLNISIVNALWVLLVGEQLELEDPHLAQIIQVVILVKIWLKSFRLSFWSKFGPKIKGIILFFLIFAKDIKYTDACSSVQKNSRKKHYFFQLHLFATLLSCGKKV